MNLMVDWHIHSNASDGYYTPEALIEIIKNAGIRAAITDHDTVKGVKIALESGDRDVLTSGLELSTFDGGTKVHLLGYHIEYDSDSLEEKLKPIQEKRTERSKQLLERAHEKNMWRDVSFDEIKEKNSHSSYISRVHVATELTHKGHYENVVEAKKAVKRANLYEEDSEPFVPYIKKGMEIIKIYGKTVSLAHLNELKREGDEEQRFISWLKDLGLDAIEAVSSKYSDEQIVHYIQLAKKFDLKITIGSDFHWEESTPGIRIGIDLDATLNEDILKALEMSKEDVYSLLL